MRDWFEKMLVRLQNLLPQRWLTRQVYRLMRSEVRWLKNTLITVISGAAGVDWREAPSTDIDDYTSFNAFFTRPMRDGARPLDPDPSVLICPSDGRISEAGRINGDQLLQAKGRLYSLTGLLAEDESCHAFEGGLFCTVYLSPRDYHRVHMPFAGQLQRMIHVPGDLFSVAPYTVRQVPDLFARNERVVSVFDSDLGPLAVVLVGAMLVASMETVWAGAVTPADARETGRFSYPTGEVTLARGEEMGRFNMGSTVICLLPRGVAQLDPELRAGMPVRMGQRLATLV